MPLPKPPASKGSLLSATDYETQAAARTAKRSLQAPVEAGKEPLALTDAAAASAAPRLEAKPATAARGAVAPPAATPVAKPRPTRPSGPTRLFVLDTNVLMQDRKSVV